MQNYIVVSKRLTVINGIDQRSKLQRKLDGVSFHNVAQLRGPLVELYLMGSALWHDHVAESQPIREAHVPAS